MLKLWRLQNWTIAILAVSITAVSTGADITSGRNLNPYHEQQLQQQIRKCASGVLACTDEETRCIKQQELCQLLMRAERYDEALQVAHNIYNTKSAGEERRAAHHYLIAEIYIRKMRSSPNVDEMERNRQFALSAAKEIVSKNYPSKWQVSERARAMIRDLSDSKYMAGVQQRVLSRQGNGDSAKEAIADAQRRYLDATHGRTSSASPGVSGAQFQRVIPETSRPEMERNVPAVNATVSHLPAAPTTKRVVTPTQQNSNDPIRVGSRLSDTGLMTSQAGDKSVATRQPILVNGQPADDQTRVDAIVQNNLQQLREAARRRQENARSPYATGELPSTTR